MTIGSNVTICEDLNFCDFDFKQTTKKFWYVLELGKDFPDNFLMAIQNK
jgi:hypothetical protein